MDNIILSVIGNKILAEILHEVKLYKNNKVLAYEDLQNFLDNKNLYSQDNNVLVYFIDTIIPDDHRLKKINMPIIFIVKNRNTYLNPASFKTLSFETILLPLKISDFSTKIKICLSKNKFFKNSLIYILEYMLDINKREITKGKSRLKLTEREVNLLLHLKEAKKPVTIEKLLEHVWKYSFKTETHTVETHVHRLRKKFLKTFDDNKMIKNNNRGYYI